MKALLHNGSWVEIDTTYLFNNQYNTKDGKRIFDKDIAKIDGDIRADYGKCRYCGAIVKRGEEEKHFAEREARACEGCFWYRDKLVNTEQEIKNRHGETITVVTSCHYRKYCSHAEEYGGCTNDECRKRGVEWFTPENTFFLKFPNGFTSIPDVDKLEARGFVVEPGRIHAYYFKKLGSYHLAAVLHYEDGKPAEIAEYRIHNARRDYTFRFENGELFTDKYSFGWRKVNTLEGVPASVMDAVKKICGGR